MINEKRSCYRVKYPAHDHPKLLLNSYAYGIIEISSNGLKIRTKGEFRIKVGSRINARIELKNGSTYDVTAKVVRSSKEGVALKLETEISSKIIFAEERYILEQSKKK